MQPENAFKLGSILLLVGFSMAGANNVSGSAFSLETIRSESPQVELVEMDALEQKDLSDIRNEVEEVQEINKMNISEFAPYKIR